MFVVFLVLFIIFHIFLFVFPRVVFTKNVDPSSQQLMFVRLAAFTMVVIGIATIYY
ncbi:hypothetical protein [Desulfuribacillus stibiiarsenatis]|uniref:hypothetical protein n=1 Tax=Desulfuribacillus stibiiarsenatis TaxID=1390249 RepID=UPI0015B6B4FA|nr:hypothetical protein [Desulfuribacillus stibiiarsenatis]